MTLSYKKRYKRQRTEERLHIDVFCPKCGTEMTELEFNRKNLGGGFMWESFRKCPECGAKVKWQ